MTRGWPGLVPILNCPACRQPLSIVAKFASGDGVLGHPDASCLERYPVIDSIPRLLTGVAREGLRDERAEWFATPDTSEWFPVRTTLAGRAPGASLDTTVVSRFDAEWMRFAAADTAEQSDIFKMYFDLVPPAELSRGKIVLDAGCGAGRWAVQVAKRGAQVVVLDAGRSVEIAFRNGASWNVAGVQGDVTNLPFDAGRFDLVYSLGVLHHVGATERAAAELVRVLRPGGSCLIYLYYALDGRGPAFRAIHGAVGLLRRVLSRAPQMVLGPVTTIIAAVVYLPLARLSRVLRATRLNAVAAALPLSAYADRSFRTMRNDSLDRFGTRIEKRYTRSEVTRLMSAAGLVDIRVAESAPYWHAIGRRPS